MKFISGGYIFLICSSQEKLGFLPFRNSNTEKLRGVGQNTFVWRHLVFQEKQGTNFSTQSNTLHRLSCFLGNFLSNLFLLESSGSAPPRGSTHSQPDSSPQKQDNTKSLHLTVGLWADIPVHSSPFFPKPLL